MLMIAPSVESLRKRVGQWPQPVNVPDAVRGRDNLRHEASVEQLPDG